MNGHELIKRIQELGADKEVRAYRGESNKDGQVVIIAVSDCNGTKIIEIG